VSVISRHFKIVTFGLRSKSRRTWCRCNSSPPTDNRVTQNKQGALTAAQANTWPQVTAASLMRISLSLSYILHLYIYSLAAANRWVIYIHLSFPIRHVRYDRDQKHQRIAFHAYGHPCCDSIAIYIFSVLWLISITSKTSRVDPG